MLAYADAQEFVQAALTTAGYGVGAGPPMPYFDPGPGGDLGIQDTVPQSMVIITLTSGPGLDSEEVFDRAGVQVRTVGMQQDYESAETLAQVIDKALVGVDSSQRINNKWTLSIVRAGGAPSLLLIDDGNRFHFTCNYIWEVQY